MYHYSVSLTPTITFNSRLDYCIHLDIYTIIIVIAYIDLTVPY